MSHPFPPTALRRRHSQTVRDRASSYKIDYIIVIKSFLNPEWHQNPTSSSKVTAILLKGWIRPIGEASAGEGLRLQPAQQACSATKQDRVGPSLLSRNTLFTFCSLLYTMYKGTGSGD